MSTLAHNQVPLQTGQISEDGDVMAVIIYTGTESTHTVDIDSNALVLEAPAATQAASIDLTDSSYNTYGEVADYINDNVTDWEMILVGALRADSTYSSDLKIVDPADASVGTVAGYQLKSDSSTWDARNICLGLESFFYVDSAAPSLAGVSERTLPRVTGLDPIYSNTTSGLYKRTYSNGPVRCHLDVINLLATDSSTSIAVTVTPCTQDADGTSVTLTAPTSGTRKIYNAENGDFGPDGFIGPDGHRLVIKAVATGNISASDIGIQGRVALIN